LDTDIVFWRGTDGEGAHMPSEGAHMTSEGARMPSVGAPNYPTR
jgi:hypothetical protein